MPTGHVVAVNAQEAAPAGLKAPEAHAVQSLMAVAPAAGRAVPAGQGEETPPVQ